MTQPVIIRHATGQTPAGPAFVAWTDRGLCALALTRPGEAPALLADLRKRSPKATLIPDPEGAQELFRQISDMVSGTGADPVLVLDVQGTPFQQAVWKAMTEIPRGSTCSYSELARRIGKPRAVRAVASACARNPVAVIVPCHRVVCRDGNLGGYRGGLPFKRRLLLLESAVRNP